MTTPARIRDTRSYTVDQLWCDKDAYDRAAWFEAHADAVARARGKLVIAAEEYGALIKSAGAAERRDFTVQAFIDAILDTSDAHLAPEVSAWLDSIPTP